MKDKSEKEEGAEADRGSWDSQCDFFLSCLGYAVGLGNVWRFPYLCYQYGGVTFLIAYLVMLFLTGLPLFFLELALGQYAGKSAIKVFGRMGPGFKGVGYAMLVVTFLLVTYYNIIIAWSIYYTVAGFSSELPWTFCGSSSLTSRDCFQRDQELGCFNTNRNDTFWDKKCTHVGELCRAFNLTESTERDEEDRLKCFNMGQNISLNKVYPRVSPSEDYYKRTMLGLQPESSWSNLGGLKWELVLCLAAAWALVALCLCKGVQSSGKVVYFTALFPYLVLVILLIRGLTLDGAYDGIIFYIYPSADKIAKLKNIEVWAAAATQIFYSLGTSMGGLMTMASYNRFNNNCHRDAITIAFSNCATSIFAGFVIFSIVGFMAKQTSLPVDEVIQGGPGLAFIAYPEAVTQMPFPQLWSFLFFSMLICLGLDTQFTLTESITTAIMDQHTELRNHKGKVVSICSIIGFILGLSMCTRGGIFMFELMNWYSASFSLIILAIAEVSIVVYFYGHHKFMANIEEMGIQIPKLMKCYWLITWKALTPLVLGFVLVMSCIQYSPAFSPSYAQEKYVFPPSIQSLGWLMVLCPVALIVAGVPVQYFKSKQEGKSITWESLRRPTEKWGPAENNGNMQAGLDNQNYTRDT